MAELLAHQGQPHELLVLVAVADDEVMVRVAEAQDGHQAGLAAALQADAELLAELHHFLHHVALLVHLDRVDRGVAALIAELLDRVGEVPGQRGDARAEDVGEAEQQGKADTLRIEVGGQLVEIESALGIAVRMDGHVSLGVDPEEAEAPAVHVVELFGVLRGPGRCGDGAGDVRLLWRAQIGMQASEKLHDPARARY